MCQGIMEYLLTYFFERVKYNGCIVEKGCLTTSIKVLFWAELCPELIGFGQISSSPGIFCIFGHVLVRGAVAGSVQTISKSGKKPRKN